MSNNKNLYVLGIEKSYIITSLFENFDDKKNSANELFNNIIKNLDELDSFEDIPEWLVLSSLKKKDLRLVHLHKPLSLYWISNSDIVRTYYEHGGFYDSYYYNEAKEILEQLGYRFKISSYIKSLQKKPPKHIKPYTTTSKRKLSEWIRKQLSESCIFGIKCSCGNQKFSIRGLKESGYKGLIDPIIIECIDCSKQIIAFDSKIHGYDAKTCNETVENDVLDVLIEEYVCPNCSNSTLEISCGFEYSIDREEAKEIMRELNIELGIEELFTWYTVAARCINCGAISEVTSIECS